MNFGQVITAMVTPFDDEEDIDFSATRNLIEHLIATGTEAVVVAGTTGESPTLTVDEKIALFSFVVKEVNGRIPVIAGTGSNNTRESVQLTKAAEDCGVDGVMLVAPYYNRPAQEGLYAHFKIIAAATHLPVMLYNVPARSACNIDVETVVRLAQIKNIVSIKEASGDLDVMAEIIRRTPDDFSLYSGDDGLTLPVLAIGGAGVVSVSSHIIGKEMQAMIQAFGGGNVQEAGFLHRELLLVINALFSAPNPTAVKAALNLSGVPVGNVRLPLIPLNEEQLQVLKENIQLRLSRVG